MGFILWLIVGALAGWGAGMIVKGGGFGLFGDIIVGLIGGFIGGKIADILHLNLGGGFIDQLVTALVGSVILVFILHAIKRS